MQVTVNTVETVTSTIVLEIRTSDSAQLHNLICKNANGWRNGKDTARVRIVNPETVVEATLDTYDWELDPKTLPDQLIQISSRLKHGLQLRPNGLWMVRDRPIILAVPLDLKRDIQATMAGKGLSRAVLAKKLNECERSVWERRFCNCFHMYEPNAATLAEMTDNTWVLLK